MILILSDSIAPERLALLQDALPAFLRALRQPEPLPGDAGAIEYDSWRNAGALEYDSWRAR